MSVRVGEVFALVRVGQDHVASPPRGLARGASQEEGVWSLSVVSEILDEDVGLVKGVDLAPDTVVDVLEGSNSHWAGGGRLRTADQSVSPVPADQLPHRPDDLPLLLGVGGLLGHGELGDDGVAGLDGDAGGVKGTAGDGV